MGNNPFRPIVTVPTRVCFSRRKIVAEYEKTIAQMIGGCPAGGSSRPLRRVSLALPRPRAWGLLDTPSLRPVGALASPQWPSRDRPGRPTSWGQDSGWFLGRLGLCSWERRGIQALNPEVVQPHLPRGLARGLDRLGELWPLPAHGLSRVVGAWYLTNTLSPGVAPAPRASHTASGSQRHGPPQPERTQV